MPKPTLPVVPHDTPIRIRPGVMHREADFFGSGMVYTLPPEHPERTALGDLGSETIKDFEPRALTHDGLPFANLRSGK
jgi:hypothetical protein